MKKTKIVATLGPASSDKEILRQMFQAGVNVCRLNFSHGSYEDHSAVIKTIRELNDETGCNVAILADLQGPKIRTNEMENNGVELINGTEVTIVTDKIIGTAQRFSINYPKLPQDVKPGERILLDDGKLALEVVSTDGKKEFIAKVIHGGILSSKKGVNFPNTSISMPSLTEKDLEDLNFALENNVDWIGLSFVRSARDIIELKHIILDKKGKAKVIAKIEKPEAIEDIDNIIQESDGLMVARGDLGVELPMEQVPLLQKMIVQKCVQIGKPVIIATQMMESMITSYTPTRAEVNDVANAVMDGADAVMLSAETSVGKYPVKVIEMMRRIITQVEELDSIYYKEHTPQIKTITYITDSICYNACSLAHHAGAQAIISMTNSGYTAFKLSSHRPKAHIFIFTDNLSLLTTLSLIWGIRGFYYNKYESTDETINDLKTFVKSKGFVKDDDLVINIASMPMKEKGRTNMMKLSYIN